MKTFFRISAKQAVFSSAIASVALLILFLQYDIVEGKSAAKYLPANTPVAGAKMVLTKVGSSSNPAQASLTATSGSDGKFTFPSINTSARGGGMVTYKLSVSLTTPVQVSVTFNQLKGLTAGGGIANTGPLGPLSFSSKDSLQIGVAYGGVISGTVTK
jgi:hypothetical protein